jgi:hypothetical protein
MEGDVQLYDLKGNKLRPMSYIRVLVLRTTSGMMNPATSVSNLFTSGDRHGNS